MYSDDQVAQFGEFLDSVELHAVYLAGCTCEQNEWEEEEETESWIHPSESSWRVEEDDQGKVLVCGADFAIGVDSQVGSYATFRASYVLIYRIEPSEDWILEEFARRNAVYNAWPFFRELVQSLAGRMGIAALVLPLLVLPPFPPPPDED